MNFRIAKHHIREIINSYPSFYFSITRHKHLIVTYKTEVVIEGYPRSANSFAVHAFNLAQKMNGRPNVNIAHHLHAPAQIKKAAKFNIPTLVLIRQPRNAVISVVIKTNSLSLKTALKNYINFYSSIYKYKNYYCVALFDEVINDYGRVIHRLNLRFSTSFAEFDHSEENVKLCFDLMMNRGKLLFNNDERKYSIPTKEKNLLKSLLNEEIERKESYHLLKRADSLYKKFQNSLI